MVKQVTCRQEVQCKPKGHTTGTGRHTASSLAPGAKLREKLTTAGHLRRCDLLGALLCDSVEGCLNAHLLGGAGHMHCHIVPHLSPLQLVHEVAGDELHRLVQVEPASVQEVTSIRV